MTASAGTAMTASSTGSGMSAIERCAGSPPTTGATPTTEWQILTGVTGSVFGGPGKDETDDDLNRVDPSFAANIAHNGKYLDTGASFFFDMAPASFAQLEETGVTEGDATPLRGSSA